ncbi:MAG: DUF1611 domain-containing protein [Planctomycetaceae bacterium]|nr:MAG: DUF1611 domain-containing protein [Planctomycetaceae bacterium]
MLVTDVVDPLIVPPHGSGDGEPGSGSADLVRLSGHRSIVLLTEGFTTPFLAKTAINLLKYRSDDIAALVERGSSVKTTGELLGVGDSVPVIDRLSAVARADALYVGIAPPGGKLPEAWRPIILEAIARRLDIVSGLHEFLVDDPEYVAAARTHGARLIDVRRNRFKATGTGKNFRPGCVRVHTVGHDCSIGKMVASLEVQLGLVAAGHDAAFLATGQTGIMISGRGVPIDCVVSDFVSGAAEQLVAEHEQHDYLLVEGQGSLTHPAFSAVTLGLLHGCAPDGLIFCYEAGRKVVKGFDPIPIPDLEKQLDFFLAAANFRHPCRLIGVAINSRTWTPDEAAQEVERAERRFGVPACDVYRHGPDKLVDATIRLRQQLVGE